MEQLYFENDFDKTFKSNKKLMFKAVNNFLNILKLDNSICIDDLYSIASFGLYKAFKTYKVDTGVKWSTYATSIMNNELKLVYNRLIATKRCNGFKTLSLEYNCVEGNDDITLDYFLSTYGFEDEVVLNSVISSILNKEEKELLDLIIKLGNQAEVAKYLNTYQVNVSRKLKKIRIKLEGHI